MVSWHLPQQKGSLPPRVRQVTLKVGHALWTNCSRLFQFFEQFIAIYQFDINVYHCLLIVIDLQSICSTCNRTLLNCIDIKSNLIGVSYVYWFARDCFSRYWWDDVIPQVFVTQRYILFVLTILFQVIPIVQASAWAAADFIHTKRPQIGVHALKLGHICVILQGRSFLVWKKTKHIKTGGIV